MVVILAIAAAILSYSALRQLAVQSGIDPFLSYLFPVVIDGLILSGTLLVLYFAVRGVRSKFGIFLTLLGVIASIAGNVAISDNNLIHQMVHGAPALVLFLSLEALTVLLRTKSKAEEAANNASDEQNTPSEPVKAPTYANTQIEQETVSTGHTKVIPSYNIAPEASPVNEPTTEIETSAPIGVSPSENEEDPTEEYPTEEYPIETRPVVPSLPEETLAPVVNEPEIPASADSSYIASGWDDEDDVHMSEDDTHTFAGEDKFNDDDDDEEQNDTLASQYAHSAAEEDADGEEYSIQDLQGYEIPGETKKDKVEWLLARFPDARPAEIIKVIGGDGSYLRKVIREVRNG